MIQGVKGCWIKVVSDPSVLLGFRLYLYWVIKGIEVIDQPTGTRCMLLYGQLRSSGESAMSIVFRLVDKPVSGPGVLFQVS